MEARPAASAAVVTVTDRTDVVTLPSLFTALSSEVKMFVSFINQPGPFIRPEGSAKVIRHVDVYAS